MLVPSGSPFETMPPETKMQIGIYCTFPDLNQLALASKMGSIWANALFDLFANEIECEGKTPQERKSDLAKLYREISPNFIRSLFADIDKIKDRVFENGKLTVEYGVECYTPYFLIRFASDTLRRDSLNSKEIVKEFETTVTTDMFEFFHPPKAARSGIIVSGSTGITINQAPSNHVSNVISTKLLEALKKASVIYFKKLCSILTIPDLNVKNASLDKQLEKYKNKYGVMIDRTKGGNLELWSCHCVIERFLHDNNIWNKVAYQSYDTSTAVYGEREDILKFITILNAQQFPDQPPTLATLKQARGLPV